MTTSFEFGTAVARRLKQALLTPTALNLNPLSSSRLDPTLKHLFVSLTITAQLDSTHFDNSRPYSIKLDSTQPNSKTVFASFIITARLDSTHLECTCLYSIKLDSTRPNSKTNSGTRELTLKCKFKCYFKPMNNPLGVSPSKGKQGTTRGKEKIF